MLRWRGSISPGYKKRSAGAAMESCPIFTLSVSFHVYSYNICFYPRLSSFSILVIPTTSASILGCHPFLSLLFLHHTPQTSLLTPFLSLSIPTTSDFNLGCHSFFIRFYSKLFVTPFLFLSILTTSASDLICNSFYILVYF